MLPVGEAQHRQVRARQVQVVGVLAHDLGTSVVGRREGLEEVVIAVEVVVVHLGDVVGLDPREHEVVAAPQGSAGLGGDPVDLQAQLAGPGPAGGWGGETVGEDDRGHRHLLLTGQGPKDVVDLLGPDGGHQRCDGGAGPDPLPHADGSQHGLHAVAVGVPAPDLTLCQVGHVVPEGRVGHERAHGVPCLGAVGDLGQGACGQQAVDGRRRGAHHGSTTGQDLDDAARQHGGAVHHGADVEEDGVGAVGAEHLAVGEAASHV